MKQEIEQLREALASSRRLLAAESQRLREHALVLNGIQALSVDDEPDVLLERTFELLSSALPFDEAYVLEPSDDLFTCVASTCPAARGATWPMGAFFRRVAAGGAAVVPDNSRVPEWVSCQGITPESGGAIYAPIRATQGQGLLILCAQERGVYSSSDLALVLKLGLLVSQTLAAGQRQRLAEEIQRSASSPSSLKGWKYSPSMVQQGSVTGFRPSPRSGRSCDSRQRHCPLHQSQPPRRQGRGWRVRYRHQHPWAGK